MVKATLINQVGTKLTAFSEADNFVISIAIRYPSFVDYSMIGRHFGRCKHKAISHKLITLCQEVLRVWLVGWIFFQGQFFAKKTANFAGVRTWLGRGTAAFFSDEILARPSANLAT